MASRISETELQVAVIGLARLRGWKVHHSRKAPRPSGRGWATPISGDAGAPDLFLARGGVVLLVELKSQAGRFGPGQKEWGEAIGEQWRCWRPGDWLDGTIAEALR